MTDSDLNMTKQSLYSLQDYRGVHIDMYLPDAYDSRQVLIRKHRKIPEYSIFTSILPYIPHNPVILDIGANIGSTALWFYQIAGASKVIAVEPNLKTFNIMETNIKVNGLEDKIYPMNIALGSEEGYAKISFKSSHNTGLTTFSACDKNSVGAVRSTTVDNIIQEDQHIDFMKIDVEGSELKVLNGARSTIERCRPIIFIEIWSPGYPRVIDPSIVTATNYMNVIRFFSDIGYVIEKRLPGDNNLLMPKESLQ